MINIKQTFAVSSMVVSMAFSDLSYANFQDLISEEFASGATFTGIATFDDNLLPISIDGTLTDYELGTFGFVNNAVSEAITWVNDPTYNFGSSPIAVNWWLDVSPTDAQNGSVFNSLLFSIDFTNPLAPVFTNGDYDNGVNTLSSNADFLVSGSIRAVPEPSTIALLGLGLLGIIRMRQGNSIR